MKQNNCKAGAALKNFVKGKGWGEKKGVKFKSSLEKHTNKNLATLRN